MRMVALVAVLGCALAGCSSTSPVRTVSLGPTEVPDCYKPGAPTGSHIVGKYSCESMGNLEIMTQAAYEQSLRHANRL
jgi:hypothetical protein